MSVQRAASAAGFAYYTTTPYCFSMAVLYAANMFCDELISSYFCTVASASILYKTAPVADEPISFFTISSVNSLPASFSSLLSSSIRLQSSSSFQCQQLLSASKLAVETSQMIFWIFFLASVLTGSRAFSPMNRLDFCIAFLMDNFPSTRPASFS